MRRLHIMTIGCAMLVLWSCCAGAAELQLSGYWKSFLTAVDTGALETDDPPPAGQATGTLRLAARVRGPVETEMEAAYELEPRVQDRLFFAEGFAELFGFQPSGFRVSDLDRRFYPSSDDSARSFGLFQNLDRLHLQWRLSWGDLDLGRQAVAWGMSKAVSPLDFAAPYAFNELDVEERIGVDAARLRIPVGMLSEIDLGYLAGEDFDADKSGAYLRGRFYVERTDLSVLGAVYRDHLLAGAGMARAAGGAGIWTEASYTAAKELDDSAAAERFWRVSAGADYNFSGVLYAFLEYHYSGAGTTDPDDYIHQQAQAAFAGTSVYLLGEHYLSPGASWQLTPLITADGQFLFNVGDGSGFAMLQGEHNVAQNVYLRAGVYIGFGPGPSLGALGGRLRSEFGAYPDLAFASFRVYF
ncbi:MAG: hypothetical protein GF355_08185 [Candidatus Eisenbacteria bacterium]|nr:hypothetical protein [Candidatus Eisenbacteria bacterium]